jgi:hypothetical protein
LIARYNAEGSDTSRYSKLFADAGLDIARMKQFNFDWIPLDLKSFRASHLFLDKSFQARYGFSFEVPLIVVMALFYIMVRAWQTEPLYMYQSFQRAYTGPSTLDNVRLAIHERANECAKLLDATRPSEEDLDKAISFLTRSEEKRSLISVLTGGPIFLFIPSEDGRVLTDFAWLYSTLHYLFLGLPLNHRDSKGRLLEALVTGGTSILPDGECKGFNGQSREVDAAFGCGRSLIIVECKANARSIAYDRGDFAALSFRRKKFEDALDQIDEKAVWLSNHPKGINYDISNYEAILPVVVTPFKEFMPSLNERYWIRPQLPRVLMPHELKELLGDPEIDSIVHGCPCTVFIPIIIPRPIDG